jgi:hypothetical protein
MGRHQGLESLGPHLNVQRIEQALSRGIVRHGGEMVANQGRVQTSPEKRCWKET